MFLKSLTLRGFKSFADKTVLDFEPGVTVVVGPNGSGKSNLVDAVAWVLGAQGPRSLRGAKMDDVIFAGTPDRPALGRAEVSLTIDNSAGLLPIDFSEVTITRTLFRAGDSEYQLNGAPCRLLDIQELLSDSGIGRQQHVIVGQGQLDTVLNSRPEDRRAVVEEAAGILKFRRRRERAERRLEATEGNLLRLNDLLREVRRQLTPLQRQADAARRHGGLEAELRAIRLHLVGHEIAGLQAKEERLRERGAQLTAEEHGVTARLRELDVAVVDAEHALTVAGHGDVADALARVEALRERARGLGALVAEKRRGVEREIAAVADEGVVETLVADAMALRDQLAASEASTRELEDAHREVAAEEAAVAAERAQHRATQAPAAVDEVAALQRELQARREAAARAEVDLARVAARHAAVSQRVAALGAELGGFDREVARARDAQPRLDHEAKVARAAREAAEGRVRDAERAWREAESASERWRARADTLAQALDAARGSAAAALADLPGVVGPVVDHLEVEEGFEAAVATAIGDAMTAVVVATGGPARAALERLAGGDGRALLLVVDEAAGETTQRELVPTGTRRLVEVVRARIPGLRPAIARLLAGMVVVDGDWSAALDVALAHPEITVVTRGGDRFGGAGPWRLGSDASGVTLAALEEAEARVRTNDAARTEAEALVDRSRAELERCRAAEGESADASRAADLALESAQRGRERVARERAERELELRAVESEEADLRAAHDEGASRVAVLEAHLPELEHAAAQAAAEDALLAEQRRALQERADDVATRRRDLEVRVAQLDERRRVVSRRLAEVEERLARDPERRAEAERHRSHLEARGAAYESVGVRLGRLSELVERLYERFRAARRIEAERASEAGNRLEELRTSRAAAERELVVVREHLQRRGIEEAETRMRLEAAVERLRTEYDVEPAVALDSPLPDVPDGTTAAGRARELERELRLMGPINPLALEEHDALLERHEFLQAQLEDVKSSRRELQRVIRAVDREIVTIFTEAFADVSRHFESLFATLFPGGGGRLLLTDPDDMLNTGIEMEARPSGKNVRRLSLLSGGERSLSALAFLFAVFRARPSPFYLLDEVEAALDDVNLHRFLDLVHEFRAEAQLLIVSHQKRTMEAGDCLYGVSMPPGGSSRVISQRVTDHAGT